MMKPGRWYIGPVHGGVSSSDCAHLYLVYVLSIDDRYVSIAAHPYRSPEKTMGTTWWDYTIGVQVNQLRRFYHENRDNTQQFDLTKCNLYHIRAADFYGSNYSSI